MRVGFECNKSFFVQLIDDPLHILTMRAQVASEPRNRLRPIRLDDGAEVDQRALVKPRGATSLSPAASICC